MKINNNFLMYSTPASLSKTVFKSKFQDESKYDVSYAEAHKVLSDKVIMDCIAVELSKVVAMASSGKTKPTSVEEFKDNILKLFAFNKKAHSFSETLSRQGNFDSRTMQTTYRFAYDDYFERQPKVKSYTQLDERIDKFSRYHKVDSKLVLPELKEAFASLSPEIFDILPDGLISNILKSCSCDFEDGKIFLNEDMSSEDKVKYLVEIKGQIMRKLANGADISKNKKNSPKLLQDRIDKILLAQNIIFNLAKIEDEFNVCELELLFTKSEKGRYLKPSALGNFQAWLSTTPFERDYYKKLDDLRKMIY